MRVARAGWSSASFLLYAGALIALGAAAAWLGVLSAEHSRGAFAGWSVLFWAVVEAVAFGLLLRGRRLAAGLFGFVGLGLFAVMVGAFFSWFGWLGTGDSPFAGFHWSLLGLELLVLVAALVDLAIFRFPLIVAVAAGVTWLFVTDLLSSGGNWSAWVTLLVGLALFAVGTVVDAGDGRPYGFWLHVVAGLSVGGALIYFWHSGDTQWALITVIALVFIGVGAGLRRSSYAVLGALGLIAATGFFSSSPLPSVPFGTRSGSSSTVTVAARPAPYGSPSQGSVTVTSSSVALQNRGGEAWRVPLAYLCLGLFLAFLGLLLYRPRDVERDSP